MKINDVVFIDNNSEFPIIYYSDDHGINRIRMNILLKIQLDTDVIECTAIPFYLKNKKVYYWTWFVKDTKDELYGIGMSKSRSYSQVYNKCYTPRGFGLFTDKIIIHDSNITGYSTKLVDETGKGKYLTFYIKTGIDFSIKDVKVKFDYKNTEILYSFNVKGLLLEK